MMRRVILTGAGLLWIVLGFFAGAGKLWAAPQAAAAGAQDQTKLCYTLPEYNAYKDADAEANPQQKITKLDSFVKSYPNSCMMVYIYPDYFNTYLGQKNFAQAIEYADRQIALGDKIDAAGRLAAFYVRAQAYFFGSNDKAFQTPDMQTKARDAAAQGLKTLDDLKKPDATPAEQFAAAVKQYKAVFNTIAATTSMGLKDYPSAVTYYKALLEIDPTAAASHYSLGVAELTMNPPAAADGFWELARAIALKVPNASAVQTYLKNKLIQYQGGGVACSNLVDEQVNTLLTLAASSGDRPATLSIPSAADLAKALADTENFIPVLKAGGDASKVMWLASCGQEYPDVGVYAMENAAADGDTVTIKVYRPSTVDPDAAEKEMEAASDPNMVIKVAGQPEASRIQKSDPFRFTGTLTAYSQNPFLLTWDKAKINTEDLPAEKAAPGTKKAPAKKAPAKKAAAN
jgi:tetratricopeptide (TPR) repeat protein